MTRTPDSDTGQIIRHNVDRILRERGMTASEFYQRLGWGRAAYSKMFKRANGPRVGALFHMARILGAQPFELLLPPVYTAEDLARAMNDMVTGDG